MKSFIITVQNYHKLEMVVLGLPKKNENIGKTDCDAEIDLEY